MKAVPVAVTVTMLTAAILFTDTASARLGGQVSIMVGRPQAYRGVGGMYPTGHVCRESLWTRRGDPGQAHPTPPTGTRCHQPCPGSLPPGPVLPSARPCQGLAPEHLLPQGQRVVLAGWQGVLGSWQPLPQPLTPRHSRVWWLRVSRCRVYAGKPGSPVLRRPGGAQGTGQPSPAPLPPRPASHLAKDRSSFLEGPSPWLPCCLST